METARSWCAELPRVRDRRPPAARGDPRRRLPLWSPPDPGIDLATYWERCWPNHGHVAAFEFKRLAEIGDEVVVTYEAERTDGSRFRNTELFGSTATRSSPSRSTSAGISDRACRRPGAAAGGDRPRRSPGRSAARRRRSAAATSSMLSGGACVGSSARSSVSSKNFSMPAGVNVRISFATRRRRCGSGARCRAGR